MTKPITAVAALQLFEEGRFDLNDELARYLPEFADPVVYVDGPPEEPRTRPAAGPILIWHLFTHSAGLTYGFQRRHPVDAIYRLAGYDWARSPGVDLATACDQFARMPLVFDPGAAWNYSVATDVLGRLVEVLRGQPLDVVLSEHVLGPLSMRDTGFVCGTDDADRMAAMYLATPEGSFAAAEWLTEPVSARPTMLHGGAGLVSSAGDYHRFATMLARGGELDGVRVVARSTVELLSANHLPGGVDLADFAVDAYAEPSSAGLGVGLGVATVVSPARLKLPVSEGTISWGGAASTTFWVDRREGLTCVLFTQLMPNQTIPVRRELQRLVYPAIVS